MSEWPEDHIKRIFNLKRWTKMKKGGHFAALEKPDLLIKDIRAFARTFTLILKYLIKHKS